MPREYREVVGTSDESSGTCTIIKGWGSGTLF